MQTNFTLAQLATSEIEEAESILRKCVHCGFCLATCPTYVLLGDELDSPRGRIYLIKQMLERGVAPAASVVTHIDRCLSCLSCASTCPSGVDYGRLIDRARVHIDQTYQRPWRDNLLRGLLALVVPRPWLFRLALLGAWGTDPGGPPDFDGDGDVGIVDFLELLGHWGLCPGVDAVPPASLASAVQGAGLIWPSDWDAFAATMTDPNASAAEKDRWSCWMHHYLDVHSRRFFIEWPNPCPAPDPFGGH
ncbi:MAG: 4Fe-4S dicluster domain-containing protein [Planctomycetes bacterium]|nr:4Fe-4S dicluster domain-containing protein [Planctomycetota bacterium]